MRKYFGDKEDSDITGSFLMMVSSFLFSFVIIGFMRKLIEQQPWVSSFLILGFGYLFYNLGYNIKERNIGETISSIKNLLLVLAMVLLLCIIILIFN